MQAITGAKVSNWSLQPDGETWAEYELRCNRGRSAAEGGGVSCYKKLVGGVESTVGSKGLFQRIVGWHESNCIVAASLASSSRLPAAPISSRPPAATHRPYAVIGVVQSSGHQIVRLRNVWGEFEWEGDWSYWRDPSGGSFLLRRILDRRRLPSFLGSGRERGREHPPSQGAAKTEGSAVAHLRLRRRRELRGAGANLQLRAVTASALKYRLYQ
jgi:hypothetical protein